MPHNRYLPTDLAANPRLRLFALPHAGGGAAAYVRWRPALGAGIDIVPIHLPGREERLGEPPLTDWPTLVGEIAGAVAPLLDRPFALVGNSFGAWLAFELVRALRRRGERLPAVLIAAASAAPHRPTVGERLHRLPDDEFEMAVVSRFDGIPPAVRASRELMALMLPALRADITLLETYDYVDEPPLAVDIVALGGAEDRAVSAAALADWRRHTAQRFSSRQLPGGHFFLLPTAERDRLELPAAVHLIAAQLERYHGD